MSWSPFGIRRNTFYCRLVSGGTSPVLPTAIGYGKDEWSLSLPAPALEPVEARLPYPFSKPLGTLWRTGVVDAIFGHRFWLNDSDDE